MPSVFGMLNVGRTALTSHQKAMDVTGNNIANVGTPGYTRQRLNLKQSPTVHAGGGAAGTGVAADPQIQRLYDRFVTTQINNETPHLGGWEAQKQALEKIELMFDEVSGYGLNTAMDEFWTAWQDLANNPAGQVERITLGGRSQTMADTFNQLCADIHAIKQDIDANIQDSLDQINSIAARIAAINGSIAAIEVTDRNANDLRDQRDALVKQLAAHVKVNAFEDSQDCVNVTIAGGRALVNQADCRPLAAMVNASGFKDVVWQDGTGGSQNITGAIDGGRLHGWLTARDSVIPAYVARLDELAGGIITAVNALHRNGYTLNGTTDQAFFSGSGAANMALAPNLAADSNLIAASATAAGVPGDNTNAIAIAALRNALTMSGHTTTYGDFYRSIVSQMGTDVSRATTHHAHLTAVVGSLEAYREEVSGVSLDEEMINLVKSQHAYNAAAKLIKTADELLAAIVNMI